MGSGGGAAEVFPLKSAPLAVLLFADGFFFRLFDEPAVFDPITGAFDPPSRAGSDDSIKDTALVVDIDPHGLVGALGEIRQESVRFIQGNS